MPLIIVYNLWKFDSTIDIEHALKKAVADIPELNVDQAQVSVFFPRELDVPPGAGTTIIVELLFDKPERTPQVRQRLARNLGRAFKSAVERGRRVKVAVKRFNPEKDGFYSG